MIEIKCTGVQKRRIVKALVTGMTNIEDAVCLFPRAAPFCVLDPGMSCEKCVEKRIKFILTDAPKNTGRKVARNA